MIDILKEILQFIGSRFGGKPGDLVPNQIIYYDALIKLNDTDSIEWQEVKEQYLRDLAQQLSMAMQSADSNPKLAVESLLKARIYHDLVYTARNVKDLKREAVTKTVQQKIQNEAAKNLFKK